MVRDEGWYEVVVAEGGHGRSPKFPPRRCCGKEMGNLPGPRSRHLGAVVKAEGLVKKASSVLLQQGGTAGLSVLTGRKGPNSRGQELGLVSAGLSLPLSRTSWRRASQPSCRAWRKTYSQFLAQSSALLGNPLPFPEAERNIYGVKLLHFSIPSFL